MSAVIDTRQSYLDETGAIVSSGRLVVYKLHTTELADIFQDAEHTLPLANPIGLSSASWTSTQVYSPDSLTVELQAYQGVDGYDIPIYSTVKTFDSYAAATAPAVDTGSIPVVDTIPDLRMVSGMEDLQVVPVKGYSTATDCYVRKYLWSESSAAVDNGGTVISSNISPTGRWILLFEEGRLDIRAFGVIPGATDVNSQFRAACNWAATANTTIVIPPGAYNMASSGTFDCYCALDVQGGAVFNRGTTLDPVEDNWYKLRLHNPDVSIKSTLAGTNVQLTLHGAGWEGTVIPSAAFSQDYCFGYSNGTASFILDISSTQSFTWQQSCPLYAIRIAAGVTANMYIHSAAVVSVDHLEGTGSVSFMQNKTFAFRELRTSQVASRVSYAMGNTTSLINLDSPVTLHRNAQITAYIEASGLGTLNTTDATAGITGGYGGKANFILSAHGLNVGYHSILQDHFSDPNGLVSTWNISAGASGDLDMGGSVSTASVTRSGRIYNGTIAGASCGSLVLDRVTVTGPFTGSYLTAHFSNLNGAPNIITSNLHDCILQGNTTYRCDRGSYWSHVNGSTSGIICSGGNATLKDVVLQGASIIPDNTTKTLANLTWKGGTVGYMNFDASVVTTDGESVASNVAVEVFVTGGINAVNGSTRRWAIAGHYNVDIITNKLSTRGMCLGTFTKLGGSTNGYGYVSAPVFVFRTDDVAGGVNTCLVNGFSATDSYASPGPVSVWHGASVLNTPRALRCGYYGQSGSNPATGTRINVSWNAYPQA